MYDELAKRLRCQRFGNCPNCPMWYTEEVEPNLWRERCAAIDAAEAIEELICEVADEHNARLDAEARLHWIPVTERLPKYGERVLVFGGVTMYVAYYDKNRYGGESWHKLNSKSHYCNPTHWMPLPEPPKENGKSEA